MATDRIPVLSKVTCEKLVCTPSVVVFVGMPGTAKTFLARKLCNYLRWVQIKCKTFHVDYYGTHGLPENLANISKDGLFTEQKASETAAYLDFCYNAALDDILRWLDDEGGHIAILDGSNSTALRRRFIYSTLSPKYKVFYVENMSSGAPNVFEDQNPTSLSGMHFDEQTTDQSDREIALSMQDATSSLKMLRARIDYVKKTYEPLDSSIVEENSFIRILEIGKKFVINRLHGRIPSLLVYYMMNLRLTTGCIYIVRHGESEFNMEGRIGGDSPLSENGRKFAQCLAEYFASTAERNPIRHVLTSTLLRTKETAAPLLERLLHLSCDKISTLDEINAGNFDGLTYDEVGKEFGDEMSKRESDKFNYRYPLGESYQDLIARIEPVILYLERTENVLLVCHQAVARCLIGYFMGKSCFDTPNLRVDLHKLYKLHLHSYQTICETVDFGVQSVDTYRGSSRRFSDS